MNEETKKNIDESWKESAKEKKEAQKEEASAGFIPPEPDFNFFVTMLSVQASIALGITPNPATNQAEENLQQAKFLIDTLGMLKDKTKGNLNSQEDEFLENLLYELRMQYLAKTGGSVK